MPDKVWKQFERRVAKAFGGKRNALSGRNSGAGEADVIHPHLVIECKQRKRHAVLRSWDAVHKLAEQESRDARKVKKLPVVALSEKGRPGFWLVIKDDDLPFVAAEYDIGFQMGKAIRIGSYDAPKQNWIGAKPAAKPVPHVPDELASLELYRVDGRLCAEWPRFFAAASAAHPGMDILAEVRKAHAWEVANPASRWKHRTRFLHTWLSLPGRNHDQTV